MDCRGQVETEYQKCLLQLMPGEAKVGVVIKKVYYVWIRSRNNAHEITLAIGNAQMIISVFPQVISGVIWAVL